MTLDMATETETAVRQLLERIRLAYPRAWAVRFEVDNNREASRGKLDEAVGEYVQALAPLSFKAAEVPEVMHIIRRYHEKWIAKPYMVAHHLRDARRMRQRQQAAEDRQRAASHITKQEVEQHRTLARQIADASKA